MPKSKHCLLLNLSPYKKVLYQLQSYTFALRSEAGVEAYINVAIGWQQEFERRVGKIF